MSIFLNDNFSTEFPKPLDNRYGPFDDVASALAFLEPYKRYIGLTVGIGTSTIIEYWFDGGILDANFIVKSDHSVVDWGDIGGTLSNQTDLQTALNLKLDASIVSGGLTGQILAKDSNADYDVSWIDNYTEDIRDTVKATEAINKGQAVYISGANGTNQLATKADYSGEQTSSQTIGLAYQNFVTNQIGQIITQGLLTGIDTSSANAAGDPVYLGANGNLIYGYANKPKAPYHLVYIGIVTRKNANNGEIYVKIQNGYELEELHNVAITSPTNNQGIFYNSTNGLWENKSIITALGYTPVSESGSYSNPTWLTALAWGKITSTPTTLSGYGITDGVSTSGLYSNPSWITDLAFSKITGYSVPTLAQVTTAGATTTNAITVGGLTSSGNILVSTGYSYSIGSSSAPFANIYSVNYLSPASFTISAGGIAGMVLYQNTRNLVIQNGGTFTDAGFRLDVNGTFRAQGEANVSFLSLSGNTAVNNSSTTLLLGSSGYWTGVRVPRYFETTGSITASSAIARGVYFNQTLVAAANNDVLVGLDIRTTSTVGSFTGVATFPLRMQWGSSSAFTISNIVADGITSLHATAIVTTTNYFIRSNNGNTILNSPTDDLYFRIANVDKLRIFSATSNVLIQNGGTFTDAGFRLDVQGTLRTTGIASLGGVVAQRSDSNEAVIQIVQNATAGAAAAHLYSYGDGYLGWVGQNTSTGRRFAFESSPGTNSGKNFGLYMYDSAGANAVQAQLWTRTTTTIGNQLTTTGTITAASAIARGVYFNQILTAAANGDTLVALDIAPTFNNAGFTNISQLAIRCTGTIRALIFDSPSNIRFSSGSSSSYVSFALNQTSVEVGRFFGTTGNFLIQNGGTFTDAGYRLDVNGSTRLNGALTLGMTPIVAASVVSTHKLQVTIAGTTYYLLASNV